ncbi:hypothetical protein [Croceimicrobium sp.]|uniref:hypothetical protein n=1 Tax=Croceimicrobium sp. TaxID=2828340 RepID=UPI003BAAAFC1
MGRFKMSTKRLVVLLLLLFVWYLNRRDRKECIDYTKEIVSSKEFNQLREEMGFWQLPGEFAEIEAWRGVKEFRVAPDSIIAITLGPCVGSGEYDIIVVNDSVNLMHVWDYHWERHNFVLQFSPEDAQKPFIDIEITHSQFEGFLSDQNEMIEFLINNLD